MGKCHWDFVRDYIEPVSEFIQHGHSNTDSSNLWMQGIVSLSLLKFFSAVSYDFQYTDLYILRVLCCFWCYWNEFVLSPSFQTFCSFGVEMQVIFVCWFCFLPFYWFHLLVLMDYRSLYFIYIKSLLCI